ncbi:hypothetical protein IQK56_03015 [Pseudomonas sp. MAFF 301449]|uniref:Uncharacterized protein n=1 Tax=Pseudomonas cyclaminis TaxID=2781239 RepID=A0ABR9SM42_9PSED|nr:hypothetical protein [Pseudomonas cyclaminis]MBE8589980.1 hypothetical protein [Pseudomonas cyclaminis]MBE8599793.1 hypothetical protein [Pseudomonas cyclaminis]
MTFDFRAPGSLGPIAYEMERAEVRACLGANFRCFKKTFLSTNTLDAFDSQGMNVYYSDNDRVKGVELFRDSKFTWMGESLLGGGYIDLKKFLSDHSINFHPNDSGVEVDAYGVSFYIPDISDEMDEAVVESVYIDFCVGQTSVVPH